MEITWIVIEIQMIIIPPPPPKKKYEKALWVYESRELISIGINELHYSPRLSLQP